MRVPLALALPEDGNGQPKGIEDWSPQCPEPGRGGDRGRQR